ncbi:Ppx/GppA family phosphatase [Actinokineospora sp. PR83]|uniref:Ppx/GppA phosphatase family protein n=1 Tax=Actinokineospora sp. PR83 TaxID=2884908 RepID=UPI001F26F4CF|nr:Ppx/GppA phosphatase family protein [Actinokineospora sp. PR83]MCG8920504.1 Ppx/GppA family phosphatase [Actinokineospora sp. PR83]
MSRVAAIDCGTNSIRLLVAEVQDGRITRDLHREMRVVRLGEGVDATGRISAAALERTRAALVDYVAVLRRKGVERARMVATSATRDAVNKDEFFAMTEQVLGFPAEVITGDEEAELSFVGAVGELDPDDGPFLVADVGGGSTELVLGTWDGTRARVTAAKSTDIGCVRLTERALPHDPPTPEDVAAARAIARDALADAFAAVPVAEARTWVGVAGTVTTIAGTARRLPAYDPDAIHLAELTPAELAETTAFLIGADRDTRAAVGVMHPGRVDVIGGGSIVVDALAERIFGGSAVTRLVVSEHDILDGIALSITAQ